MKCKNCQSAIIFSKYSPDLSGEMSERSNKKCKDTVLFFGCQDKTCVCLKKGRKEKKKQKKSIYAPFSGTIVTFLRQRHVF